MFQKSIAVGGLVACALTPHIAHAQSSGTDSLSLQIANAVPADRFFVRAGVIGVKIKTKSGNTYDVTGPVVTKAELQALIDDKGLAIQKSIEARDPIDPTGADPTSAFTATSGRDPTTVAAKIGSLLTGGPSGLNTVSIKLVTDQMTKDGITQLGTPIGVKAVAEEKALTAGLSLGYYLGDDYSWVVEAFVLAKPIETGVLASGLSTWREIPGQAPATYLRPFGLEGQKIITTKLLPPTVMLGKYWGGKNSRFRLYTGAIAMYAMFYDTKATDALNSFVGGSAPGDTTVSFKNTFGMGPMLGAKLQLNNDWHLSFNMGSVKLKTQGTVVTRNTTFTKDTLAIQEFGRPANGANSGGSVSDSLQVAEGSFAVGTGTLGTTNDRAEIAKLGGVTGVTMGAIAYNRGQTDLGTFVRKADSTLTSTLFLLSVGRSF